MKTNKSALTAALLAFVAFFFLAWFFAIIWINQVKFYFGAREVSVLVQKIEATKELVWMEHGNQTQITDVVTAKLGDGRIVHLSRIYVAENSKDRKHLKQIADSEGQVLKVWMHRDFPEAFALEQHFPFNGLMILSVPLTVSFSGLAYMAWWRRGPRKEK